MAETATAEGAGSPAPLDDVMLAMDVVDTLRHREHVIAREFGEEERESDLLERLRKIYAAQGIEVPDRILKEGVEGLKRARFSYEPPAAGLEVWLARAYVTRLKWGKVAAAVALGLVVAWAGYTWGWRLPAERRAEAQRIELAETLPARLASLVTEIEATAQVAEAGERAAALAETGRAAASAGDLVKAREAAGALEALRDELALSYEVRIVSRPGEWSVFWREPEVNPDTRNLYVVVEAIGPDGAALARPIRNEENGETQTVTIWGQRVTPDLYDAVTDDKRADGIVDDAVIGTKARGYLEPAFRTGVEPGAITEWEQ